MSELSREEARKFIAEVREDNGGISAEDRAFLEKNLPSALRALQNTRRHLAGSIKLVVDNLYSKDTRFLYELIQNAEDNSYSTATANGEESSLIFKLHPDRIIVDSNEDGFSESNIRAICSVGKSTKNHSAGYIGEKGIGFKSVFKIARRVHIQSGPFSFAFSHTRKDDDDGLGMVTPEHEDAEDLPVDVRTRITLTLLDPTKFEELASEFLDVPDTFLMFLSQLQKMSIELYNPDNTTTLTRYSKRETRENGLYTTFLTKTSYKGKEESSSEQKYYTLKSDLHDLPSDQARMDKQGNSIDRAMVILAFPVDEHDEPVLKEQYTFAFLPLRQAGFKFLIQCDFVTQANREDVVFSKRNRAVLEGVAEAFADAVIVLCEHPSLRYRWMRYLPEDFNRDDFWGTLWPLVRTKLEQTPLLEPWSGNGLYKPSYLKKLSKEFIAEDQSPLLPDLKDAEIYLSPKYTEADFEILRRLGTKSFTLSEFLDRLEADLLKIGSKWRNVDESAGWRTRICRLLSKILIKEPPRTQKHFKFLNLIPLNNHRWVPSDSKTKKYFPTTDDIPIPTDLGFDLILPIAAKNVAWADLLSKLDVISCSPKSVIESIRQRYKAMNLDNFTMFNAVAHIRYLYWHLPIDRSSLGPWFRLANQHGSLLREGQYLYFPNGEDDYSPARLFKQDAELHGHPVNFLHEDYLHAVDPEVTHNGRSWMTWLEEIAQVRRIPELCASKNDGLSSEFQYIVDHRSDRTLGTLKRGWTDYRDQISNAVKEKLQNSAVLLENGHRTSLLRTFLPLPKLKQIAAELLIADAFPFIAISELLRDEERLEWTFVKDLQVGIEDNLDFYLSALGTFKSINPLLRTASARVQLARIYQSIQSRCSEGLDRVYDMFKQPVIWVQSSEKVEPTWFSTADCIWDGPQWLKSKQCLKLEVNLGLEHLFKVSLKVPDASQTDVINDLVMLKSHSEDKSILRSQSTANIQSNIGTIGTPYHATSAEDRFGNTVASVATVDFQSITSMEAYIGQSFEELRLEDYELGRKPLSMRNLLCERRAFAGLECNKIIEEVEKRYDYLWQTYSSPTNGEKSEAQKTLRFTFKDFALVYIPKENTWRSPSQCVWAESSVEFPGKASIADVYSSKKTFFTTVLKISEPTVEMHMDSLKANAGGKASAAQSKETMALICSLGLGKTDFSSLVSAKFLPVKLANGVNSFASASSKDKSEDFAIMDNAIHWNAFKGKIVVLDLTLEEIRDTKSLLLAMGLAERFSSKLVKEITDVKEGSQDYEMTRILRTKSQAIVRCAVHFASLEQGQCVASLYRKFKRAIVYVSDGIRCLLQIMQGGRNVEVASSRANFHIEEAEDTLRLYLPKNEVERDVCFESDLPRRLCRFLSITDPTATGVVGGVFRKDSPAVIDKILENAGVGQVHCDFAALDEELGASDAGLDVETLIGATSNIRLSTPDSGPHPYTTSDRARRRDGQFRSPNMGNGHDKILPSPSDQDRQREHQKTAYKRILENVINVARQRVWHSGVFESAGVSIQGPVATEPLTQETIWEVTRTQDREFKIGAAGELYMFEYLKGLGLPRFDLENWKSQIRDRVKVHPNYHDLEKSEDRSAIADIEYLDDSRRLTQFLTQKGHLAPGLWDNKKPLYHIEIKTTTSSDWQEPFFMSKAQERHIQSKSIEDGLSRKSIYMICRIFNLGKGDETGMHIYLDPEMKRKKGELDFSTHTWAVKPLMHPTMPARNGSTGISAGPTTRTASAATGTSGDGGTNYADREAKFSSFTGFGPSTNSIPKSSNPTFGSSTSGSQKKTESRGGDLFGSNTATFGSNTSTQPASGGGLFGETEHLRGSLFSPPSSYNTSTQAPLGSSLFGSVESLGGFSNSSSSIFGGNRVPTQTPPGGNLFGATKPAQGSLFGSPSGDKAHTQTPSGGSLFGRAKSPSNLSSSDSLPFGGMNAPIQPLSGGNPFGATEPRQGGLFGSLLGGNSSAQNSNSFGSKSYAQPSSSSSLFGSTESTHPPKSSLFGQTIFPQGGLFGSSFGSNTSAQPPPRTSVFGTTNSSSTEGIISGTFGGSSDSNTSASPRHHPFGSSAASPFSNILKATPENGLFGSSTMSGNDDISRDSSKSNIFASIGNNDASRGLSPSITGASGFGSSSSTASMAPSAKNSFGFSDGNPSSNSSKAPFTSGPFSLGTEAVSSNDETLKPTSSTSPPGTANFSFSSRPGGAGGLFGTNPSPPNPQVPSSTTTGISTAAEQPSSSTTTGLDFGSFGTFTSTLKGTSGTNASDTTHHHAIRLPQSTTNPFSAFGGISSHKPFGSTSTTDTVSTSTPTTSAAPSAPASTDSGPPGNLLPTPFNASHRRYDMPLSRRSPSSSPTPRPRSTDFPEIEPTETEATAGESQPAASGKNASDKPQPDCKQQ